MLETAQKPSATANPEPVAQHSRFPGTPDLEQLTGGAWRDYRKALAPRYGVVWRHIGSYYLLLGLGFLLPWIINPSLSIGWRMVTIVPIAVWMTFWLHGITSFMHEATHFLVHPNKKKNDQLADWFVCSLMGQSVARYRKSHWQHHLHLGGQGDTETTYLTPLSWRFVLTTMSGWHIMRVLLRWRNAAPKQASAEPSTFALMPLLRFAGIQVVIIGACALGGRLELALAWLIAVFAFFPAVISVQNILEHRSMAADATLGQATNRLFGTGWLARNFGAAGFNRHLLHHWDPQISYTRFDEMEAFLMQTPAAPLLDQARTTYVSAWRQLWRHGA